MTFDEFVESEYYEYRIYNEDPMEFDDWFAGSDYLYDLFKEVA